MWWQLPWLLLSFLLYIADQGTDCLTALLLIRSQHYMEGALTVAIVLVPGVAACIVELVYMWRGDGSVPRALALLLFCPLWAPLTHLYSLHNTHWRTKALLLKTVQGLLSSGPQLVLQLSLFMRGTLTLPVVSLLHQTANSTGLHPDPHHQDLPLTLFGRDYDSEDRYYLGIIQLVSILISFLSVLTSVLHFNEFETGGSVSLGRLCLGLPFFCLTILYRAVGLGLTVCFLQWWASVLVFLLFFLPVLASLCAGDSFPRSCLYGLWSLLAPVGYARDPLLPLGYTPLRPGSSSQCEEQSADRVSARSHYFLSCHLICSLAILGPALVLVTALVQRAALLPASLHIHTQAVFPLHLLSSVFLPLLGLALGVTLLLAQPYRHIRDCGKGRLDGQKPGRNVCTPDWEECVHT